MAIVPELKSQVQLKALPSTGLSMDAPAEAFGAGKQTAQAFGSINDFVMEQKAKADQVAFMDADSKLSSFQTQLQFDPKNGFQNQKGKAAFGLPEQVQEAWTKGIADIEEGLSSDSQRQMFRRSAQQRWADLDKNVQRHVGTEIQNYDAQTTDAYLANEKNSAISNFQDPQAIGMSLERQKAAIIDHAARNGMPDEWAKQKFSAEATATHAGVISQMLASGQSAQAKAYFDTNKDGIAGEAQAKLQKEIENGSTIDLGVAAWNKFKGVKLSDGTPDLAKIQAAINSDSSLTNERKEKVWDFVKGKASEATAQKNKQDAANDNAFMNSLVKGKTNGVSLDDALRSVNQYGQDDYDKALKADVVKKMYAPPSQSDPATFISIWEKVQDNNSNKNEIDQAFQKGKINEGDWRSLREAYYKANDSSSPDEKNGWARIKILANDHYGSDKDSAAKFLYEVRSSTNGKTPDEQFKIAQDKLKSDPSTGIGGFFQKELWKTDLTKRDAQSTAWGKAYQDLGKNETLAIGQGALYGGKKGWSLSDIESFAGNFGGYDQIKPGTPAHNAIQSLIKNNQLVTPANVKAVLDKYKDGKY